jgi:hypothetical protein
MRDLTKTELALVSGGQNPFGIGEGRIRPEGHIQLEERLMSIIMLLTDAELQAVSGGNNASPAPGLGNLTADQTHGVSPGTSKALPGAGLGASDNGGGGTSNANVKSGQSFPGYGTQTHDFNNPDP